MGSNKLIWFWAVGLVFELGIVGFYFYRKANSIRPAPDSNAFVYSLDELAKWSPDLARQDLANRLNQGGSVEGILRSAFLQIGYKIPKVSFIKDFAPFKQFLNKRCPLVSRDCRTPPGCLLYILDQLDACPLEKEEAQRAQFFSEWSEMRRALGLSPEVRFDPKDHGKTALYLMEGMYQWNP